MSENISNITVDKIKHEVLQLIDDCINSHSNSNSNTQLLQDRYSYLYATSKTLFEFIIRETRKSNFNKERFDTNLEFMLSHIKKIQNKELTQNDASESVGELVAKQFIPQLK